MHPDRRQSGGFSLVELVMVIMIIGVLGAIAVPRLTGFTQKADVAGVAETLRRQEMAFLIYKAEHGTWPADKLPTQLPSEMSDYLSKSDFAGNPLGGEYDWQEWANPKRLAGGVHVSVEGVTDWEAAREVDAILDDGNLKTGAVVKYNSFLLLTLEK